MPLSLTPSETQTLAMADATVRALVAPVMRPGWFDELKNPCDEQHQGFRAAIDRSRLLPPPPQQGGGR